MSYELNPKNPATRDDDVVMSNAETLGLISLEPRILLDAAGFVTGAEVAAEAMVAEGAEIGVQAIFDSNDDAQAIPIGGPWLGDIALAESIGTADDSSGVIPIGGPWLGDIELTEVGAATSEV